jgi:hypothetical protein
MDDPAVVVRVHPIEALLGRDDADLRRHGVRLAVDENIQMGMDMKIAVFLALALDAADGLAVGGAKRGRPQPPERKSPAAPAPSRFLAAGRLFCEPLQHSAHSCVKLERKHYTCFQPGRRLSRTMPGEPLGEGLPV